MKTFKPGIYAVIAFTIMAILIFASLSKKFLRVHDAKTAEPNFVVQVEDEKSEKSIQPAALEQHTVTQKKPEAWNTRGMWRVEKYGYDTYGCLYSDEQIAANIKNSGDQGETSAGLLCAVQKGGQWIQVLDVPGMLVTSMEGTALLEADFIQQDGSKYYGRYFIRPYRPNSTMYVVDLGVDKPFGYMITHAKFISLTVTRPDGTMSVQHYMNGIKFSNEEIQFMKDLQ